VTDDEDTIIAGLMHDSLEDVPGYTYANLAADCGERVAEIVKHVTEPLDPNKQVEEQMPWLERQEIYLENLRSGGVESALVSMSDKIHNTESLFVGFEEEGAEFIKHFSSSLKNKLWFQERVLEIVREKIDKSNPLLARLENLTIKLRAITEEYQGDTK
jgi:(p)ppGpp synthase/HD superfamily hydrolase